MKQHRSIRLKLLTLYVGLLTLVFIGFGFYIYIGFQQFLVRSLQQTVLRRAQQIADTILNQLPARGAAYVGSEIQARYAPELNERVIRIMDAEHRTIYASRNADHLGTRLPSAESADAPLGKPSYRVDRAAGEQSFRVVSLGERLSDGKIYTVEVGAPESAIETPLHDLLATLLIGFPVLIAVAILGGYSLLGRALRPVDEIVGAAERITFKNINQRLLVPQTGDEFERIAEALNRMIDRLDESFQTTNRFAGDASHELRTPLTIIRGELESFMRESSLSTDSAERVGNILEEVTRLSRIVEGLLLVSRLEAGEARIKTEKIDLAELVTSTAEQMELLGNEKHLSLHYDVHGPAFIEGDKLRLRQVVVNLIDNAIKYTPEGGTITLRVFSSGKMAVIEVIDTGMGISPEALPRIFNRFFRAEEARSGRMEGTGLGLAIVESIVAAHGGSVTVESQQNRGANFRIQLPLLGENTTSPAGDRS